MNEREAHARERSIGDRPADVMKKVAMVDFSEALKARIASMSPDDLAATEQRRRIREAEAPIPRQLNACWDVAGGAEPTVKEVAIHIDPGTPPLFQDIIRFSQGTAFLESVILTLSVYRSLAGGASGLAAPLFSPRFVVHAAGVGVDQVTVDTADLAKIVEQDRPALMARAHRLVAAECRSLTTQRLTTDQRITHFEEQWEAEEVYQRIDAAVSAVWSRAMLMMSGKDHVALWVRKADFMGEGLVFGSPLTAAIVPPVRAPAKQSVFCHPAGDHDAFYIASTSGGGAARTLVLDVAKLRKVLPALPKEARDKAISQLEGLVVRNGDLARDRSAKTAMAHA